MTSWVGKMSGAEIRALRLRRESIGGGLLQGASPREHARLALWAAPGALDQLDDDSIEQILDLRFRMQLLDFAYGRMIEDVSASVEELLSEFMQQLTSGGLVHDLRRGRSFRGGRSGKLGTVARAIDVALDALDADAPAKDIWTWLQRSVAAKDGRLKDIDVVHGEPDSEGAEIVQLNGRSTNWSSFRNAVTRQKKRRKSQM